MAAIEALGAHYQIIKNVDAGCIYACTDIAHNTILHVYYITCID